MNSYKPEMSFKDYYLNEYALTPVSRKEKKKVSKNNIKLCV